MPVFHVMLVLPVFIVLGILVSILLVGIAAVVSAVIGGTTVTLLVKEKTAKKLLFIGFFTVFFIGLLCLSPIVTAYLSLPIAFFAIASVVIYICITVLSIAGMRISLAVRSRVGRAVLIAVFCVLLVAAVSLTIFTGVGSYFFARS